MAEYQSVDPLLIKAIQRASQRDYLPDSVKDPAVGFSLSSVSTNFTIAKDSPTLIFDPATTGDNGWYVGVPNDLDGTSNDILTIGVGSALGDSDIINFEADGDIAIQGGDLTLSTGGNLLFDTSVQKIEWDISGANRFWREQWNISGTTYTWVVNQRFNNLSVNPLISFTYDSSPSTNLLAIAGSGNMGIVFGSNGTAVSATGASNGSTHFRSNMYILATRDIFFSPNTSTDIRAVSYSGTTGTTDDIEIGPVTSDNGLYLYAGSTNPRVKFENTTEAVFNDDGADYDFRLEGDTDTNLIVLDASADTVQIGSATTADSAKFYVAGKISTSGEIEINGDLNHDGSNIGFFGIAPTTRQTELTDELTTISSSSPGTPDYAIADPVDSGGGSAFGFSTSDEFLTAMTVLTNLQTRQNELETKLVAYGLLIDAD